MRLTKKILLSIAIVMSIFVSLPIIVPAFRDISSVQAASTKISSTKKTLNVKESLSLKVTGTKEKITWSSSNKNIASVNSKGKVVANKKGTTIITAKVGKQKLSCKITVENPTLNVSSYTMNVSEKYTLKVKNTTQKINWSSSNKNIATVDTKGNILAKKKGSVTITAKIGNTKYTCKIKVEDPQISSTSTNLFVNNTYTLKINGTSQTVNWSSSNSSIVSVNSYGIITANSKGTATIIAKVGKKQYSCQVSVVSCEENISVSYYPTKTSVIAVFTNNNSFAVSIEPDMIFYDINGKIQSKTSEYNFCFEPHSSIAMEFSSYNTSTYESQEYSSYKLSLGEVTKSYYTTSCTNKISVNADKTDGCLVAEVTNNSGYDLDTIQVCAVFYDSNNNVIGYYYTYAECYTNGSSDFINLYYPYDENYDSIEPASYKIYVNHAYNYNF